MSEDSTHSGAPHDFLVKTDGNGRVVFVSESCYSFFDIPASIGEGVSETEIELSDHIPGFSDLKDSIKKPPHVYYDEVTFIKNQREYWISWTHTAFLTDNGIQSVVSYGKDITKNKVALLELEKERIRLDQIIQATQLATWEWDLKTNEVRINQRWAHIPGYTVEELQPTTINTWASLAHPDDLKLSDHLIREVIDGKSNFYELECRLRHKDGHWVWVLDRGAVTQWDPDGKPRVMSGTHTDITAKKMQEQLTLKRLYFMDLVGDMSVKLNRADSEMQYRETLQEFIQKMGEYFDMCRAYMFEFNSDLHSMSITHEWTREGVSPEIETEAGRDTNTVKWWMQHVRTGEILIIPDVQKMPEEASLERSIFEDQDIKAMISIPTVGRYGTISGVLGFDKTDEAYEWPEDQQLMMRILAEIIGNVQERRKIENELKESEERFSTAFNNSPIGLAIIGPDETFAEVNRRYAEIHGYEPDGMIGKNVVELGLVTEQMQENFKKLLIRNEHTIFGHEILITLPDGLNRLVEIAVVPIFINGTRNFLVTTIDITERKRTLELLQHRDSILSAVGVAANHLLRGQRYDQLDPLLEVLGRSARASRAYIFQIYQKSEIEVYATQKFEWCEKGIEPQIDNPILQDARFEDIGFERWKEVMLEGGYIAGHVSTFPDDERDFLESQEIQSILVLPIYVKDEWWGFIGFDQCDSIRSWSKTEVEALETSAKIIGSALERNVTEKQIQLQSAALDSAANAIYITNIDGELEWINPAWSALTGYSAEEAIGKKTSILRSGIHDQKFYDQLWKTLLSGDVWSGELVNRKKDGELYYELQTITPLLNEKEQITHFIGFKQDISEQKKAEQQIRRSLREKNALLSEIHHRVKNNLAVVSGVIQLQAFSSDREDTRNDLMNSVTRIKTIANVHELLYQSESFTSIDFSENITKLQNYLLDTMGGQIPVTHQIECEKLYLNVSQAMPASLILNEVLTNAYKHAFKGRESGSIKIVLKWSKPYVILRIEDNGNGMGKQERNTTISLGMQLIDILSEQLEAEYRYEDTGKGTLFEIRFKKEEDQKSYF